MNQINQTLKQLRLQKGLTQKQMAEKLYKSRSTYGDIETGRTGIHLSDLQRICHVLDISVADLFKTEGSDGIRNTLLAQKSPCNGALENKSERS